MKLYVVAVGQRVPDWAQTAWDDYAKRFPPELKVELKAVKTEPRASKTLDSIYAAERERIEASIPPSARPPTSASACPTSPCRTRWCACCWWSSSIVRGRSTPTIRITVSRLVVSAANPSIGPR
jgi:hypothetical protein